MENEIISAEQPETPESSLEDRIAAQFSPDGEESDQTEETTAESAADEQPAEVQEPAAELVEVEFNGKTHKVPSELKDALMAQSDYTRKTQALAERQRMVDAQVFMQQQETLFHQAVAPELQQLQLIDSQLSQFKNVDWTQMDTDTLTRTRVALDQLKDQRSELIQAIEGKRGQLNQHLEAAQRQKMQSTEAYLKQRIPSFQWGGPLHQEIGNYAASLGYSPERLNAADALDIETAWKASQWDKLQSQKATTTKRAEQAPPALRPGASNKSTAQVNADAAYQKALKGAKTRSERDRIVGNRFAEKLGFS